MRTINDEFVAWIERRLNLKPRKCLGFKQPEAAFRKPVQAALVEVSYFRVEFVSRLLLIST